MAYLIDGMGGGGGGAPSLDREVEAALKAITQGREQLSEGQYIQQFEQSAQAKAKDVLQLLHDEPRWQERRPLFISIGGGDGSELGYLLHKSNATRGVLIEGSHFFAAKARERARLLESSGKTFDTFEGDAQELLEDALRRAKKLLLEGAGDFIAVSCHAVLHELYDRGSAKFDPMGFFGQIFSDGSIPVWFTYREPGVPEKWPDVVLVSAECSLNNLMLIANEILHRHAMLRDLKPSPSIVGDHLRLHRTVAMEVLCKLFYLNNFVHELQERSTSVEHKILTSQLTRAIGDVARRDGRAEVKMVSAPTGSFIKRWRECKIDALGLEENGQTIALPIPESQTRVVAWRDICKPPDWTFRIDRTTIEPVNNGDARIVHYYAGRPAKHVRTFTWMLSFDAPTCVEIVGSGASVPARIEAEGFNHGEVIFRQTFEGELDDVEFWIEYVANGLFAKEEENYGTLVRFPTALLECHIAFFPNRVPRSLLATIGGEQGHPEKVEADFSAALEAKIDWAVPSPELRKVYSIRWRL